jgi:hypothetical protein
MSKKRIKALLQYRHVLEPIKDNGLTFRWKNTPVPYYVLPATADAYEQMVEQMAKALNDYPVLGLKLRWQDLEPGRRDDYRKDATRSIRAIGIKPIKK